MALCRKCPVVSHVPQSSITKAGLPNLCRQSVEQHTCTPHLSTVAHDFPAASQGFPIVCTVTARYLSHIKNDADDDDDDDDLDI